jgi:hypothetical protein
MVGTAITANRSQVDHPIAFALLMFANDVYARPTTNDQNTKTKNLTALRLWFILNLLKNFTDLKCRSGDQTGYP